MIARRMKLRDVGVDPDPYAKEDSDETAPDDIPDCSTVIDRVTPVSTGNYEGGRGRENGYGALGGIGNEVGGY